MGSIYNQTLYTLKMARKPKAFNEFLAHLRVHKNNIDAQLGIRKLILVLAESHMTDHLRVYTLNKGNPSLAFGKMPSKTLFSIRKECQNLFFKFNGVSNARQDEWRRITEEFDFHVDFNHSISVNDLGNIATSDIETEKLTRFIELWQSSRYVQNFLGKEYQETLGFAKRSNAEEADRLDDEYEDKDYCEDSVYLTSVRSNKEQQAYRDAALVKYNKRCVVTDCNVEEALDAAHIIGYRELSRRRIYQFSSSNVLILRRDIHGLFGRKFPKVILKPIGALYETKTHEVRGEVQVIVSDLLKKTNYFQYHKKQFSVDSETFNLIKELFQEHLLKDLHHFDFKCSDN